MNNHRWQPAFSLPVIPIEASKVPKSRGLRRDSFARAVLFNSLVPDQSVAQVACYLCAEGRGGADHPA
jgi:hypothetical protein